MFMHHWSSISSPTNVLSALSQCFCPHVFLLILNCVVVMSISLEGGGGAIGAPLHPLDPLIDVTTTIHGPI
jgi:hypothetical protein